MKSNRQGLSVLWAEHMQMLGPKDQRVSNLVGSPGDDQVLILPQADQLVCRPRYRIAFVVNDLYNRKLGVSQFSLAKWAITGVLVIMSRLWKFNDRKRRFTRVKWTHAFRIDSSGKRDHLIGRIVLIDSSEGFHLLRHVLHHQRFANLQGHGIGSV